MPFDLLDSVQNLFSGDVTGQAAKQLGENESGIRKAIGGIVPMVLTGLLHKAGRQDGAAGALQMAKDAAGSDTPGNIVNMLQDNTGGGWAGKGAQMLQGLFGDKLNAIIPAIASFAGIKSSSVGTLLNAATPAALGAAGQYATQNNLDAGGFGSFLNSQKDKILGAVPSGLNLAGLLGLGSLADLGKKLTGMGAGAAANVTGAASNLRTATRTPGSNRWVWSLIMILVAIALLWYLLKGCGGDRNNMTGTDTIATTQTAPTDAAVPVAAATTRESIKVTLPDGTELDAYRGGIEDQLVTFLKDNSSAAGKDVWFNFDNLNFNMGSAVMTQESMLQVNNIGAILKAFPKTKIKIGGYTDRSGDSLVNQKLSQSRADAVLVALRDAGSNTKQLLGAEGYGSAFATVPADAPDEERKKDRHISISVREK